MNHLKSFVLGLAAAILSIGLVACADANADDSATATTITVTESGRVTIEGTEPSQNWTSQDVIAALGTPTRTLVEKHKTNYFWDTQGILLTDSNYGTGDIEFFQFKNS